MNHEVALPKTRVFSESQRPSYQRTTLVLLVKKKHCNLNFPDHFLVTNLFRFVLYYIHVSLKGTRIFVLHVHTT